MPRKRSSAPLPGDLSKGFMYAEGVQRTYEDCGGCNKKFVAKINFDLSGEHRVVCPHCGRQHYRMIEKGVVTQTRWSQYPKGENKYIEAPTEKCWGSQDGAIVTATPANYIRNKFLKE